MSSFHVPANQTVSYSVYLQAVSVECCLPLEFMRSKARRIEQAFDAGEPIWMICAELRMIHGVVGDYRPTKTALQLAKRVVRVH
jgi:hypothetical protein